MRALAISPKKYYRLSFRVAFLEMELTNQTKRNDEELFLKRFEYCGVYPSLSFHLINLIRWYLITVAAAVAFVLHKHKQRKRLENGASTVQPCFYSHTLTMYYCMDYRTN